MVTNSFKVVCPECGAVNDYSIVKSDYIDNDSHTTYSCDDCGCLFTNCYTLVYLGGYSDTMKYDRDNITVA